MSISRTRKEASKRLGIALEQRYRALVTAQGEDEIAIASVDLGTIFNENIEFIINVLKAYGGLEPQWERPMTRAAGSTPPTPANDLPTVPPLLTAGIDVEPKGRKH